ncbi:MAG: hypothetical protein SX243_21220 [Acidobacteriota bacterium]|nr:hypothetical protein [Acidobacteriota bacterium]
MEEIFRLSDFTGSRASALTHDEIPLPAGHELRITGTVYPPEEIDDYGLPRPQIPVIRVSVEGVTGPFGVLRELTGRRRGVVETRPRQWGQHHEELRAGFDPVPLDWTLSAADDDRVIVIRRGKTPGIEFEAYIPPVGWRYADSIASVSPADTSAPPAEPLSSKARRGLSVALTGLEAWATGEIPQGFARNKRTALLRAHDALREVAAELEIEPIQDRSGSSDDYFS